MDRLKGINQFFLEKERRKLTALQSEQPGGVPVMSPEEIRITCLENGGYDTAELNEKLYLHFKGFHKIQNLEPYTKCKAIWLDSNGIETIEGLETLQELRCLYLSKNVISSITGLDRLLNLHQLDLSNNRITMLQGLACCPNLRTLNVSRNSLTSLASVAHLEECLVLDNLDLTHNNIPADANILELLAAMPSLANLSLSGNELTRLPSFRKILIGKAPRLGYLDRPVDELERLKSEAFLSGGVEAERAAMEKFRTAESSKRSAEIQAYRNWQAEQRAKAKAAMEANGGKSALQLPAATVAAREAATQRAVAAEKEILGLGVTEVAKRYWDIEGRAGNAAKDSTVLLEEAVAEVKQERETAAAAATSATGGGDSEGADGGQESCGRTAATEAPGEDVDAETYSKVAGLLKSGKGKGDGSASAGASANADIDDADVDFDADATEMQGDAGGPASPAPAAVPVAVSAESESDRMARIYKFDPDGDADADDGGDAGCAGVHMSEVGDDTVMVSNVNNHTAGTGAGAAVQNSHDTGRGKGKGKKSKAAPATAVVAAAASSAGTDADEDDAPLVAPSAELEAETPEQREARNQRVAESLHIFNLQMEARKSKRAAAALPASAPGVAQQQAQSKALTWEEQAASSGADSSSSSSSSGGSTSAPLATPAPADVTPSSLYWTEGMDMALAAAVKENFFDFNLVSSRLISLQKRRAFSEQLDRYVPDAAATAAGVAAAGAGAMAAASGGSAGGVKAAPGSSAYVAALEKQAQVLGAVLGPDSVRLRWAELDASRWSAAAAPPAPPKISSSRSSSSLVPPPPPAPAPAPAPVDHRVCVGSSTADARPSSMRAPTDLPSTTDADADADAGDEDRDLEALD